MVLYIFRRESPFCFLAEHGQWSSFFVPLLWICYSARIQVSMSNVGNELNETTEFSYYISSVSIMHLITSLLLFAIMLLAYFGVIYVNVWWGLAMLIAIQGVGLPIAFLALNVTLRKYCWRQFRGDVNNFKIWIGHYASAMKQSNSRVSPLQ